jgi:hypothetical protein
MQAFWSQLQPAIVAALTTLISAAVAFAVAWLRARTEAQSARTEAQRQAVLGATHEVELTSQSVPMEGAEKKEAAMLLAADRLPSRLRPRVERLADMVEEAIPSVKERFAAAQKPTEPSNPRKRS